MNTSTPAVQRVVLYARISEDATGDAAGVDRQLRAGRELAAAKNWGVVDEIVDNDVSALRGKHRPGYAKVLDLVREGSVDQVVVWQTSRLLRNRRERAEAIELFGKQRVGIIAVKGVSFDLSTAYGRGQAGMLGEFDTMESEVKSERVLEAAADRARSGRPSGSLGYGWTKSGAGRDAVYEVEPREAAVVVEIVDRLLAGESVRAVTASLNERGEPSPESAMWSRLDSDERERRLSSGRRAPSATWGKTSVRKIARRASNASLRIHHRGRPDETVYDGAWPALVARDKHERVVALLTDPARDRRARAVRPGARRHLLTWGVGECGVCGGHLRHTVKKGRYGRPLDLYVCDARGCVGRGEQVVDELIGGVVAERLSRRDASDLLDPADDGEALRLSALVDTLQRRLAGAADEYAVGNITAEQMRLITARVKPDLEEAERRRVGLLAPDVDVLRPLIGPDARERWDELDVGRRRALVEVLFERVVIERVKRKGPGFDPGTVRIEWRS